MNRRIIIMKSLIIACCVLAACGASFAQIGLQPLEGEETAPPSGETPDLKELMGSLADDRAWWGAKNQLVALCLDGHEEEIMRLAGDFWREHEQDPVVRERGLMIVGAFDRIRTEREIRRVVNEQTAAMRKAVAALDAALEKGTPPSTAKLRELSGAVDSALRRLERFMIGDAARRNMDSLKLDLTNGTITPLEVGEEEGAGFQPAPGDEKESGGPEAAPGKGGEDEGGADGDVRDAPSGLMGKRGDLRRVAWVRPFPAAREASKQRGRVMLVKPIMGGSNTPDPRGVPCGGVNDCEGSW